MTSKTNMTNTNEKWQLREVERAYKPNSFLGTVDVKENVLGCGDGEGR